MRLSPNRLFTTDGAQVTFRADKRFDVAIKKLTDAGYSNVTECIYDAVYALANERLGVQLFPRLANIIKETEEAEEQRKLEFELLKLAEVSPIDVPTRK